jgi:hypothetical protein
MTCDPDDYLADKLVQSTAEALEDAIKLAVETRGKKFKGLTIAVNVEGSSSVLWSGCGCPACVLNILQSVGEAYGAETEVTEATVEPAQVH